MTYFVDSPFSPVADPKYSACWSGRPHVKDALSRLHQTLLRRPDQSLDLMWANLGAGKTHTLFHLGHLFRRSNCEGKSVITCFVEVPEQLKGFIDLYRSITSGLPLTTVCESVLKSKAVKLEELRKAANVMVNGNSGEQEIVRQWFVAERPHLRDLRACSGISQRIETDLAAADALVNIVASLAEQKTRLLLLFDEFQRIGHTSMANSRALSSLRSVFSRSPQYLSAVLTVQSMVESTALKVVPPELQTLIGRKPTISLPEMDLDEAEEFVLGRFDFFRPKDYKGDRNAPFRPGAIREILSHLKSAKHMPLIPREILQALVFVYDSAVSLEEGITPEEALSVLHDFGPEVMNNA